MIKFLFTILIVLLSHGLKVQTDNESKINLIANISQYIRWGDMDRIGKTFTIGVVRDPEMTKLLEAKFEQRTILGKKVRIVEFYKLNEIEACEVLYLGHKVFVNDGTLNYINTKVNNYPTLIISDNAKRIAMINLYVRSLDNALCFELNQANIENSGLIIQNSLLKHKNTTKIE